MDVLSKGYLGNLFPKPYEHELKTGVNIASANNTDGLIFYFEKDYHAKLVSYIDTVYRSGMYDKNPTILNEIKSLLDGLQVFTPATKYEEEVKKYWLSLKEESEGENENEGGINKNEYGELTDVEGNTYKTIKIGEQTWLAENFRATKYNDNTDIKKIKDSSKWQNDKDGAFCLLNNDNKNKKLGNLYNWQAINKNICPDGWRIPTENDWKDLKKYLSDNLYNYDASEGGSFFNKVGKSMATTSGWNEATNEGAIGFEQKKNNTSKFNATSGGFRFEDGKFSNVPKNSVLWWSITEYDEEYAFAPSLEFNNTGLNYNSYNKSCGFYIRLIKE